MVVEAYGYSALSSDGVTLLFRAYGNRFIDAMFARLEGRVEEREWEVDGGVVGMLLCVGVVG